MRKSNVVALDPTKIEDFHVWLEATGQTMENVGKALFFYYDTKEKEYYFHKFKCSEDDITIISAHLGDFAHSLRLKEFDDDKD